MTEGLDRVIKQVSPCHGYAQLSAGWSSDRPVVLRLEAGHRVAERLGLFGFAESDWRFRSKAAGIGARVVW